MRAEARDPLVEEPRGWQAQGALAFTPFGKGRAAKNAAGCDSQGAPCAKKKVCAVPAHSDTTALDMCSSKSKWLLLRHARFCAWPPLVLSFRPLRVPTVSVTYAYLPLPERFSSQDVYVGDFFEHGSLVRETASDTVVASIFSLLVYLFIFLSFSSRFCSLSLQFHIQSNL